MAAGGPVVATRSRVSQALLLVAAIASEVTATHCLEAVPDRPALYVVVVLGFAIAVILLLELLRRAVASRWLFKERLTPVSATGI